MAEWLTGSREGAEERSPRHRLRTVLAAASVALAAHGAHAEEKASAPDIDAAPLSSPVPAPRPDQLTRMLGEEVAAEIRVALDECLAEYVEIADELKADGDVEEARLIRLDGKEDCGEHQRLDVAIALEEKQQEIARAAIDAENARQTGLRAEVTELSAERDHLRMRRITLETETSELKAINDELSDMLIAGAICEANGGTAEECGVDREQMEDLFRRARELATPSADREPVDVTEAVPKSAEPRVASLTDPDA